MGFSLECILKNLSVETQVCNELLESSIFVFKLFEPPYLGDTHSSKPLLPTVKILLAHSHFPTNLTHRCTALGLPQCKRDLLLCKS